MMVSGTTRQVLAGLSASLSALSTGLTYSWSSPILAYLVSPRSHIPMTRDQSSWVVSCMEFGCWVTPVLAGKLADSVGRKLTLLATGPLYALSWVTAIYARNVYELYLVRIIQGFCVATINVVGPMYLGEISDTKIRGSIGTLFQISVYAGILYNYILGSQLDYWRFQLANLAISILFMVTFIFAPETPCYFIRKSQDQKARQSLLWFRNGQDVNVVENEFEDLKKTIASESKIKVTLKTLLTSWSSVRCILLLQGILVFRIFSPVQTIMAYSDLTFASGDTFIPTQYISILFAFILLLSIFPSTCLVDKAGRKVLLLVSTLGCAVFSLISCVYYYVREHQRVPLPMVYSYINFVSICGIGVFFNLGLGPLYNPLTCEYFPSNTRALSGAVLAFSSATIQLVGYMLFYVLYVTFGMYSNFLVSCVVCSFGVIWIQLYIVETKGKSFAEIQAVFSQQVR
uniref:Facilitated trehalose transporter Tret1-2 homolog n=4 Tax=Cacopsylla melanoneura TaxID=428564 RepID=A0A8D9DXX5_9HEMI